MSHPTAVPRIAPAEAPYAADVQARFEALMPPGTAPLVLFRVLARDQRLFWRFMGGGLLDKGHLSLRQREIVIDRVTARCGAEYEWGVHAAFFARRAGLGEAELRSLVHGQAGDACWSPEDALLIRFCDALHATSDIDDGLWAELRARFSEEAVLELLLLAGFYRTVSCLVNALRLPCEPYAARFPL
ncbi:MAG TPA: carboxymuconolactone decarboxylase family protein [Hyphomicrobiaceae bacterium]|nr:carboxymuconolactone decarboxylase family protein [Hyphomicrobiaceae bacterium]